jgi:hypothetical protein
MLTNGEKPDQAAWAQSVRSQVDGPGLRIGRRAEFCVIAPLSEGGATRFRERLSRFQAEAPHWQRKLGVVHDFRMFLFDGDTRLWIGVTYDGDFRAYLEGLCEKTGDWLDSLFVGVWDGYPGASTPEFHAFLLEHLVAAEFFYTAFPDASRHEIEKALQGREALNALLDAVG